MAEEELKTDTLTFDDYNRKGDHADMLSDMPVTDDVAKF